MTQRAAAKYMVRLLPFARQLGIQKVAFHSLLDNGDGDVGLVDTAGGRLQQFYALKRFLGLMNDPGVDFTPGRLNYTLTGANLSDIDHVLFQRRNGAYLLCLWQAVQSTGATRLIDVEPARRACTLNIPAGQTSLVKVYEPTFDASTTAATALQTLANPTAIALNIPDHVVVVEMIQENLPNLTEYPTALKIINVTSQSQWNDARDTANPGDHIVLDNNLDILPGTWARSGTSTNPIVIRAGELDATDLDESPRLAGPLTITGSDVRVWGVNADDEQILLQGLRNRIRRIGFSGCRRASLGVQAQLVMSGTDQWAEYCTFSDGDLGAIWITGAARKCRVRHCYIHGYDPADVLLQPALIRIGDDHTSYGTITAPDQHLVELCYFVGDYGEETVFDAIDVRAPFTLLADLHLVGTQNINFRYAKNCRADRVRIESVGGVMHWGPNNVLNSVLIDGDDLDTAFSLATGDYNSASGSPTAGQYPNSLNTKLVGCSGNVHVGTGGLTFRATGIVIEGHQEGVIDNTQGGTQAWSTGSPSEAIATPPVYSATSQGVFADLP